MFYKLRLWWNQLWIREDEFHQSLNIDTKSLRKMKPEGRKDYFIDLERRRTIAHNKS